MQSDGYDGPFGAPPALLPSSSSSETVETHAEELSTREVGPKHVCRYAIPKHWTQKVSENVARVYDTGVVQFKDSIEVFNAEVRSCSGGAVEDIIDMSSQITKVEVSFNDGERTVFNCLEREKGES